MAQDKIPMIDLAAQYRSIESEVRDAVFGVLNRTVFILGPEGQALESEVAASCDTKHGVGVGSGTDALEIALRALGVGAGDEVIVPTFTFIATAGACMLVGAEPVFADIRPDTYNIDVEDVRRRLTPYTKAIIAVDLYGQVADMRELEALCREKGIFLIEDAAQSLGAMRNGRPAGNFGDAACISFYPSKNLGGYGEGGMIVTNNDDVAEQSRLIRNHGTIGPYKYGRLGRNSRLDEIQAAILRVKFRHLPQWTKERRRQAAMYDEMLARASVVTPVIADESEPNYYLYTIRTTKRDALRKHLADRSVSSVVYYPSPLHTQPPFAAGGQAEGDCPVAEQAVAEVLSIPISPDLTDDQIKRVAAAILEFEA